MAFSAIVYLMLLLLITYASGLLSLSQKAATSSDYSALMAFKSHLVLKKGNILLSNWTSKTHVCNWYGISCLNHRVTVLQLPGLVLQGSISSDIANLTELIQIDLSSNELGGFLPEELGVLQQLRLFNVTENLIHGRIPINISRCQKLEELYLSDNFITGSIPYELGDLVNLKALRLNDNNLTGRIPNSLGNLSKLEFIYIHENQLFDEIPESLGDLVSLKLLSFRGNGFIGSIPGSIFNISSLEIVDFSINSFTGTLPKDMGMKLPNLENLFLDSNRITGNIPVFIANISNLAYFFLTENDLEGQIPSEFSNLKNMVWFEFEYNRISGNIPQGIFNISSLQILKTRHNYLQGNVPSNLGQWLPNLENLFLSHNLFNGEIPSTICNATKLVYLEVANNSFTGQVPLMLGNMLDLQHLDLQNNLLVNNPHTKYLDFLNSLVNCKSLEYLILESNPLNGILPESVGNLSVNLKVMTAGACMISGIIPKVIGNLSSLSFLGLASNNLEGNIPSSFARLTNMERIYLTGNSLTGTVPNDFDSMKKLGILHLGENKFTGVVPLLIGNLTNLVELSLADNGFRSKVPLSLWSLVKLEGLNLSMNQIQGTLASEVGNLKAITIMDISSNNFSGEIPNSIENLNNLISLYLSNNSFHGPIPNVFDKLIILEDLDLSLNSLSGEVPTSLQLLKDLSYLNISYNKLQGPLPDKGVFVNITYLSLMGNNELCGSPNLNLPPCKVHKPHQKYLILKVTLPGSLVFLVLALTVLIIRRKKQKRVSRNVHEASSPKGHRNITYYELLRATEHFNEVHLIGKGNSGMVYKGTLNDGTIVAIKVFNMLREDTMKSFDAECEVLSNVRHRNLVKIISTCSNMDVKAMVLEFMSNGSLEEWLHMHTKCLTLQQRVNVLVDIAQGVAYLHHDYTTKIVHCDLKPSNVLLDDDMVAHVADFGIAKIFAQDQEVAQTWTLGTIGYIAPEYGVDGKISTKNDVYSFGILLLETFTLKRPIDPFFVEQDLTLQKWVNMSFPDALINVLDTELVNEIYNVKEFNTTTNNNKNQQMDKVFVSIVHVGLLCLNESPEERITMREVVVHLKKVQKELNVVLLSCSIVEMDEKPLLNSIEEEL